MKALVIGATGATGRDLVDILLQDTHYTEVVIFVRKPTGIVNKKLKELITNFDKLEDMAEHIKGDVWFSCLGTTLKDAGSKEKNWHIDYEIPLKFAEIAKSNGVSTAVLLSTYSANSTSRIFYSMMKGKLEEAIKALGFVRCYIFRPGLLLRKNTDRLGEKISGKILKGLNAIGILNNFKPITTYILAEKLAKAPIVSGSGTIVFNLNDIFRL